MTRLFAPVLVCLFASPALAKDPPVIEKTVGPAGRATDQTEPGRPLGLKGRRMHTCVDKDKCRHEEVVVKIAGKKAFVQIAREDLIQVMVPLSTKLGPARVTLEIRGRGSAKTRVTVVKQGTIQDSESSTGVDPGDVIRRGFSVTSLVYKRSAKGAVFKVVGRAKVPDGLIVRLRLSFAQQTRHVAERVVQVKDGKFETELGPYRQQVNLGNWRVELFFTLGMQSRGKLRRWLKKLSKPQRTALKRVVRQSHVSVGAGPDGKIPPASLQAAREGLQGHVTPLLADLRKLLDEGREAYALAARCFYRAKGKTTYDADAYRAWLVKKGFAADDDAAKKLANDTRYGTRRGHFDAKSYTKYGAGFLTTLDKLHQRQTAFDKKTLVPVNDRVSKGVATALGLALRLQQKWTQALHQRAGVPIASELKREPFIPQVSVQPSWKAAQAGLRTVESLLKSP